MLELSTDAKKEVKGWLDYHPVDVTEYSYFWWLDEQITQTEGSPGSIDYWNISMLVMAVNIINFAQIQ